MSMTKMSQINIIEELNGKEIISQEKDIEIERLTTTCQNLSSRLNVYQDRQSDNDMLKKRLLESEQKISQLQQENATLRQDMNTVLE